MSRPNYGKWKSEEMWTLREAAYLLSNLEPDPTEDGKRRCLTPSKTDAVFSAYSSLKKALDKGSLKVGAQAVSNRWRGDMTVDPSEIIRWAIKRGIAIPEDLRSLGSETRSSERIDDSRLRVIAALLQLITTGEGVNGKAYSTLKKQESIITAIQDMHPNERGLSKRTLEKVFAEANRVLSSK